jgi:hypothetical protein
MVRNCWTLLETCWKMKSVSNKKGAFSNNVGRKKGVKLLKINNVDAVGRCWTCF